MPEDPKIDLSVILPAYEEAENLNQLLPELNRVLKKLEVRYEILVVDTIEQMDDTKAVCEMNGARYINRRNGNMYGDAVRTGFSEARGEYIVTMDADGSHEPKAITSLYEEIKRTGVDLVIGSRYCDGGYTHNGFVLRSMSVILNLVYRILFRLEVKDVSDSFRIYWANKLKMISLECDNFDIVEEILIRLKYKFSDFTVREVPINFQQRKYGVSKRNLVKFIISYLVTIRKMMNIKRQELKKRDCSQQDTPI